MISIIDYGAGNLGSVYKAFRYIGADVNVTNDPAVVERADALVLPGVGAFTHCMMGLESVHLADSTRAFIESGRPFLGICVGLQMLFDSSEEMGDSRGLGVLPGKVMRFDFDDRPSSIVHRLKIPHIGWNAVEFRQDAALFRGLDQDERVYFVHSFFPKPDDVSIVSATSDYGGPFCCAIERGNVHATQFHPEKSGAVGLRILRNFVRLAA
jgi:glutamine amidotransferase